jgi:hypothetical protein
MLFKILGIFDIITVFVFWMFIFHGWFSPQTVLFHAVYLGLKGGIFALGDLGSKIDVLVAVYIALVAFGIVSFYPVTVAISIWILVKGLWSLL